MSFIDNGTQNWCHTKTYSWMINPLVFKYLIDRINLISSMNKVVDLGFIFYKNL